VIWTSREGSGHPKGSLTTTPTNMNHETSPNNLATALLSKDGRGVCVVALGCGGGGGGGGGRGKGGGGGGWGVRGGGGVKGGGLASLLRN